MTGRFVRTARTRSHSGAPFVTTRTCTTMIIGILQFELIIHDAQSLKDKRRVVRSVKDRLHREHLVSIAEIAAQDNPSVAVLGLACVGADGRRIGQTLDRIVDKLRAVRDAELGAMRRELLHGRADDDHDQSDETADVDNLTRQMLSELNGETSA